MGLFIGYTMTLLSGMRASSLALEENAVSTIKFEIPQGAHFSFEGPLGGRIQANLQNWLLTTPEANPGLLEMFRIRDRRPVPDLVPWAGEFVGKYLISAIQARRMVHSEPLDALLKQVIRDLINSQAEDGYLGPFREEERLLGHWDLWGHYHGMLALMMWHEDTGDTEALACVVRAAHLICDTFLDSGKRVLDTGSPEMNMAVIHALGRLYRLTREDRILRMMNEIEKDWEKAGDYFRQGVEGKEFYLMPRPRWESLHDIQGLLELYQITGDERYATALENIWWSINRHDRHNSGSFSTGEQAMGDPYAPGAIETCCTIAWMALSVDVLRLTAHSIVADELERALWNAVMASQHPSGRWWTYNTPMDGVRMASAHSIVFQARQGTPELNCCSVNGPRGLGMLSEWAFMLGPDGPVINFYGPCSAQLVLPNGTGLTVREETDYPVSGEIKIHLGLKAPAEFTLRARIPHWTRTCAVKVNGEESPKVPPGQYARIRRTWQDGDILTLSLDLAPRIESGERACANKVSVYAGPLLLAFDSHFNEMDCDEIPTLNAKEFRCGRTEVEDRFQPLIAFRCDGMDGRKIVLVDFATAGAHGTTYQSWIPAVHALPAPFYLISPGQGQRIGKGPFRFSWTSMLRGPSRTERHDLVISRTPDMLQAVVRENGIQGKSYVLDRELSAGDYYWTVFRYNEAGATKNALGPHRFVMDPSTENLPLPPDPESESFPEDGLALSCPLNADGTPSRGTLEKATDLVPTQDRKGQEGHAVRFNGDTSGATYLLPYFPEDDYSVTGWVCPEGLPFPHLGQIFSAWAGGMDDPLRVTIQGDQLFARMEASGAFLSTPGVPVFDGQWIHVAAVKHDEALDLYVAGELKGSAKVPATVFSASQAVGLGMNPRYTGENERFRGRMEDISFHTKALSPEEIRKEAEEG